MLPQKDLPRQQNALHLAQNKGKCTVAQTAFLLRSPGFILAFLFISVTTCCLSPGHGKVELLHGNIVRGRQQDQTLLTFPLQQTLIHTIILV